MVNRYTPNKSTSGFYLGMVPDEYGNYVAFNDYQKLQEDFGKADKIWYDKVNASDQERWLANDLLEQVYQLLRTVNPSPAKLAEMAVYVRQHLTGVDANEKQGETSPALAKDQTSPSASDTSYTEADGREAEELRSGLERLIEDGNGFVTNRNLQKLLDKVDARDSLEYLESTQPVIQAVLDTAVNAFRAGKRGTSFTVAEAEFENALSKYATAFPNHLAESNTYTCEIPSKEYQTLLEDSETLRKAWPVLKELWNIPRARLEQMREFGTVLESNLAVAELERRGILQSREA